MCHTTHETYTITTEKGSFVKKGAIGFSFGNIVLIEGNLKSEVPIDDPWMCVLTEVPIASNLSFVESIDNWRLCEPTSMSTADWVEPRMDETKWKTNINRKGDHKDVSNKDDIIVDDASEPTKNKSQERNVMTAKRVVGNGSEGIKKGNHKSKRGGKRKKEKLVPLSHIMALTTTLLTRLQEIKSSIQNAIMSTHHVALSVDA